MSILAKVDHCDKCKVKIYLDFDEYYYYQVWLLCRDCFEKL